MHICVAARRLRADPGRLQQRGEGGGQGADPLLRRCLRTPRPPADPDERGADQLLRGGRHQEDLGGDQRAVWQRAVWQRAENNEV